MAEKDKIIQMPGTIPEREEVETKTDCKTCKWNQLCIKPPTMTSEEKEDRFRNMEKDSQETFGPEEDASGMFMLVETMALMGKDRVCPTCAIFAQRMSETPALSQKIKELMRGQEALPQCKDCGWERFCLEPPEMTKEEEGNRVKKFDRQDDRAKSLMATIIGTMLYGGRSTECPTCPVFINKLKESPDLTQQIKEMMQSWESQED